MREWTALPPLPELERVAERCIWFQPPAESLANPLKLAAYVMTYGAHEDVRVLRRHMSDDDLREVLAHPPPGVFDARSWAYWRLVLLNDRDPPPLPARVLPG